jgi:hypothetical protein
LAFSLSDLLYFLYTRPRAPFLVMFFVSFLYSDADSMVFFWQAGDTQQGKLAKIEELTRLQLLKIFQLCVFVEL